MKNISLLLILIIAVWSAFPIKLVETCFCLHADVVLTQILYLNFKCDHLKRWCMPFLFSSLHFASSVSDYQIRCDALGHDPDVASDAWLHHYLLLCLHALLQKNTPKCQGILWLCCRSN